MDVTSTATIIRIKSEFRSEILNSNGSSYSAGYLDGLAFAMQKLGMDEKAIQKFSNKCYKEREKIETAKLHNKVKEMYDE